MQNRNCMMKVASDMLTCQQGYDSEKSCLEAAAMSFDARKNKGWPGGQSFLTPEPVFMESLSRL